jgi:hypothetical protein
MNLLVVPTLLFNLKLNSFEIKYVRKKAFTWLHKMEGALTRRAEIQQNGHLPFHKTC